MARETKFGLLFVLVLASAFGVLVYKRLHQPLPLMADAETSLEELDEEELGKSGEDDPIQAPVVDVAIHHGPSADSTPSGGGELAVPRPVSPMRPDGSGPYSPPTPEIKVAQTPARPALPTEIVDDFFAAPSQPTPRTLETDVVTTIPEEESIDRRTATTAATGTPVEPDPFGFSPPIKPTQPNPSIPADTSSTAFDPFADGPSVDSPQATTARSVPEPVPEADANPFGDPARELIAPAKPVAEMPTLDPTAADENDPFPQIEVSQPSPTPAMTVPEDDPFATPAPTSTMQAKSSSSNTPAKTATESEFDPFGAALPNDTQRAETKPAAVPAPETADPFDAPRVDVPRAKTPLPTAVKDDPFGDPLPTPSVTTVEARPVETPNTFANEAMRTTTPTPEIADGKGEIDSEEVRGSLPAEVPGNQSVSTTLARPLPSEPIPAGQPVETETEPDPFAEIPLASPPTKPVADTPFPDLATITPPKSAQPLPTMVVGETYTVKPSDSFWTISKRVYGTGRYFRALAKHNSAQINDPEKLQPGAQVATPSADVLDRLYRSEIPLAASSAVQQVRTQDPERYQPDQDPGFFLHSSGQPMYRVDSNDTLSDISQNHLGRSSRWIQIFEMNRDILKDGNTLSVGTVLKLPADASQVRVVGFDAPNR